MAAKKASTYQVGFCKPPKHSQFRKGVSGNPGGRPKGSRNLLSMLQDILQEITVVRENRKRRRVSKGEAMFRSLVNRAISGDIAAITRIAELVPARELEDVRHLSPTRTDEGILVPNAILQRRLIRRFNSLYGLTGKCLSYVIITEKQAAKMAEEIKGIFGWQPDTEKAVKMANTSLLVKETDEQGQANADNLDDEN